jgi:membrane-bound lytic murein transglycosylase D
MRFLLAGLSFCLLLLSGCANLAEPPAKELEKEKEIKAPAALSPVTPGSVNRDGVATLNLPNDLWERIRKGYQMPNLETELVNDRTQWYASKPDYLQRMSERSSKYLFHIVEEIQARKMPTELALLPFIESAFNPQAVSSARASGMWQFMPATGKSFDLKQNAFRDDRRDVQASTRAALDYLERLHKMFGDWHLALAAYNWGEGNVGKAIARNKRAGLPTGYTDLNMPMETRMYVPKLQAMKNIVGKPPFYSVVLPSIPNHPYFQSVPLPRDMDVSVAAKLADISEQDFKALNPSAHRPVLLAAGTPNILLPWDNAEIFQRNYEASTLARMATWTAWIAPATMKVADAAKKVNMSEADFRAVNNIPPRMIIKAGSALLVPRGTHMLGDVTAQVADNGKLDLSPEAIAKRKAAGREGKKAKGTKTASAKDSKSDKKSKSDTKVAKK